MSSSDGEESVSDSPCSDLSNVVERMRAVATDGVGNWADVNGEVTGVEKEELISSGVIIDDGDTFEFVEDEDTGGESGEDESDEGGERFDASEYGVIAPSAWTWQDKVMGVLSLGFFGGVFYTPLRNSIGSSVDVVVSPVLGVLPFHVSVLMLAGVTGVYSSLLRGSVIDKEELRVHRQRMRDLKRRVKEAEDAGDDERLEEMRDEHLTVMWSQVNVFKNKLRSRGWVLFLNLPVFIWVMWSVGGRGGVAQHELGGLVVPIAGQVSWTTGLVGPFSVWVVWYVLCSVVFTKIVQKSVTERGSVTR